MNIIENVKVDLKLSNKEFRKTYGRSKIIATYTLGCKVNQYETEAMIEMFIKDGYEAVNYEKFADIYLINTCTVTSISDRKSRQFMRRARKKNKYAIIAVVGCYSQVAPEQVEAIEEVNLVLGTNEKKEILKYINTVDYNSKEVFVSEIMKIKKYEELSIEDTVDKTRVFMKIQDGCNQFCTYCIIPFARGPIRSRDPGNIIEESKKLVKKGFKEVVLTGIHLSSYGIDLKNTSLIEIIEELNNIEGLERIRLGSLEPKVITDDFISRIKVLDKFCNHFHLSLQSGSKTILERMNRKYTKEEYLESANKLYENLENTSITTDIIVGFPGETEEEFEETNEYMNLINFSKVHIFKYSPREGTTASKMKNQIHGDIKNTRSKKLHETCELLEKKYYKKQVGKKLKVLIEEKKENIYEGLTESYLRVSIDSEIDLMNRIVEVSIIDYKNGKLIGRLLRKS